MSVMVHDVLRALVIGAWHNELYHENQNFAENRYALIKTTTNKIMNMSGAPANTWLLAMTYVCLLLNHMASPTLDWKPPNQVLTGKVQDISKFLQFSFYEPVYYNDYSDGFPSSSNEEQGWWVGIAINVGDSLVYKVLTKQNKVIYHSALTSVLDAAPRNQRLSQLGGEWPSSSAGDKVFVRSTFDEKNPMI